MIINQAKNEMEKCPGCGTEYYAGVLSPGQACNDCQIKTAIKPIDIECTIDLERGRIVVWQGNIVIAIVTRNGLIKVIPEYTRPIYLSMRHLDIIQDNFKEMQEMYKEKNKNLKKDLTPGL